MNQYFSFNPKLFNYWPVYETVKQYYPLGLCAQRNYDELLQNYPGQEQLWQIMADNLVNAKNYRSRWSALRKELQAALKKRVHSDTSPANPCFSAYVPLRKEQSNNLTHIKELRCCISFLGPYFTIFGLDQSHISLPASDVVGGQMFYSAIHAVTVSPHLEYAELFTALEQQIQQRFPTHRFLPFMVGRQLLNGLPADSIGIQRNYSVFEALFTSTYNFVDLPDTAFRGQTSYGSEQWLPQQDGSTTGGSR